MYETCLKICYLESSKNKYHILYIFKHLEILDKLLNRLYKH